MTSHAQRPQPKADVPWGWGGSGWYPGQVPSSSQGTQSLSEAPSMGVLSIHLWPELPAPRLPFLAAAWLFHPRSESEGRWVGLVVGSARQAHSRAAGLLRPVMLLSLHPAPQPLCLFPPLHPLPGPLPAFHCSLNSHPTPAGLSPGPLHVLFPLHSSPHICPLSCLPASSGLSAKPLSQQFPFPPDRNVPRGFPQHRPQSAPDVLPGTW